MPFTAKTWRLLAFLQALVATVGSLALSLVLKIPICILCYYQRAMMYPLVLLLAANVIQPRRVNIWFSLPLAVIGAGIALYHQALQLGYLAPTGTCSATGTSCATRVNLIGPITIPAASLAAFVIIIICLLAAQRSYRRG